MNIHEAALTQKIKKIRERNEARCKRHEEIEADKHHGEAQSHFKERPKSEDFLKWKAGRELVDRQRLERQISQQGKWRRAWDAHKPQQGFEQPSARTRRWRTAAVPMATPLHKPGLEPGLRMPEPVSVPPGQAFMSALPSPVVTAGTNVAIVSIPTEEEEEGERVQKLSKQVLPPVDIDSMSETSSQRKVYIEPPYSPTRANMNLSNNAYTRQVLPPVDIDSMSETSSQRKVYIEPPYSPTRANMNLSNNAYTRQIDIIGQKGLKLFEDAGQPVDNNLVNALVREVLQEILSTMLGQMSQKDGGRRQEDKGGTETRSRRSLRTKEGDISIVTPKDVSELHNQLLSQPPLCLQ